MEEEELIEEVPCTDPILSINLKITDKRWCKEGGYGVDRISIYLKEDLAAMIKEHTIEQFAKKNFMQSDNAVIVELVIEQFFCDVVQRKTFWNCISEIIFTVSVKDNEGLELYSKRMHGIAENNFEVAEKYGKARKSLDTALDAALRSLLDDKVFRRAIKRASMESLCPALP